MLFLATESVVTGNYSSKRKIDRTVNLPRTIFLKSLNIITTGLYNHTSEHLFHQNKIYIHTESYKQLPEAALTVQTGNLHLVLEWNQELGETSSSERHLSN